jgi:hypothetical protein
LYERKDLVLVDLWSADVCAVGGICASAHVIALVAVRKGDKPMATENIEISVQGNTLVITVDLSKTYGLSASGKSEVIASTGGNISVPGRDEVKVGLNVYRPQKR